MSMNKFKPPSGDNISITSGDIKKISAPSLKENFSALFSGETVHKNDKILTALGTLEELSSYLGIIKSTYLDPKIETCLEVDGSAKLFLYARITQIQEVLNDIGFSFGTSRKIVAKYDFSRFVNSEQRVRELEGEIELMQTVDLEQLKNISKEKPLPIIAGTTSLEAHILYARTICRRAERQLSVSNLQIGVSPEDGCLKYLNRLGDYLLALSVHVLHLQNREPLRKTTRTNRKQ